MKAQFLPLFNVNLSQPQLNSTSTLFQLNFDSTSLEPQSEINLSLNINFNSISTLTSTQYGCDIKATQSCLDINRQNLLEKQIKQYKLSCIRQVAIWISVNITS